MVTNVIRRAKKYTGKPLQVRLAPSTEQRLVLMSKSSGLNKSVIVRLALGHGLSILQKSLPLE